MNPNSTKYLFNITYIILSIAAVISELIETNTIIDIFYKASGLILLLIAYVLQKEKKTKFFYVVLMLLIAYSNSLFSFGDRYIGQIVFINMIEKSALLTMIFTVLKKKDYKSLLKFNLLIFCSTAPLYYFFNKAITEHNFIVFICYILTCTAIAASYYNFIYNNNQKSFYYFLSILIFCFSEVFFGIFFYFDNSVLYVASGFFLLGFARYIFYRFMLENNKNSSGLDIKLQKN